MLKVRLARLALRADDAYKVLMCSESSRYSTLKHVESVFWTYLGESDELRVQPNYCPGDLIIVVPIPVR